MLCRIAVSLLCCIASLSTVSCNNDDGVESAESIVTILFIVFGLGVGILIQQMLSKLGDPLPYTVVVFISGLIFSSWNRHNAGMLYDAQMCHTVIAKNYSRCYRIYLLFYLFVSAGVIGMSVTIWANIDPNLLLYVFLPPLIFGEAMSLNFHHVQGGFLQSVLLAGPGVIIGMHLMMSVRCMFIR